jgi:hypothetical protein
MPGKLSETGACGKAFFPSTEAFLRAIRLTEALGPKTKKRGRVIANPVIMPRNIVKTGPSGKGFFPIHPATNVACT